MCTVGADVFQRWYGGENKQTRNFHFENFAPYKNAEYVTIQVDHCIMRSTLL